MSSVQISPQKTGQDRAAGNRTADPRRRIRFLALKGIVTSDMWADGDVRGHRMDRMHHAPPPWACMYMCYPPKEVFSISPYFHLRRFTLYRIVPRCFFSYLFFPIIRSTQSNLEDSSGF